MNITEEMNNLAKNIVELIEKDRNYVHVKEFVKSCGDTNVQKDWNSLTEKEQRDVSDELYYYFRQRLI